MRAGRIPLCAGFGDTRAGKFWPWFSTAFPSRLPATNYGSGCKDISEGGPKPRGNPPRGSEMPRRFSAHSPIPF